MLVQSTLAVLFGALLIMCEKLTPEQLIQLPRPTVPVPSPNGTWAVYSQSAYHIEDAKTVRNLYLLNIKTNTTEALTEPSYETSDSEPFFLDNDHIAYFHHHNDQIDQLYVLNLVNRASYPLTDFPTAFGNLKYNAEHQLLAFSAAVYADGTLEGAARKDKEIEETKKDSAMVFDELMVRHWDEFVQEKKNNIFTVHLSYEDGKYQLSGEPVNLLKDSGLESPSFPLGDASDYAISPDGSQVAFVAKTTDRDNAWQTTAHIYITSTSGHGQPVAINGDVPAASSHPYFTPSGQLVYFQMMTPQYEADRNRITIYDPKTDTRRVVAKDWDRSPQSLISDDQTLYVTAEEQGRLKIFAIDLETEAIKTLTAEKSATGLGLLPDRKLFFAASAMRHPTQPHLLDLDRQTIQPLAFEPTLAAALNRLTLSEPEEIRFVGAKEEEVHGWYLKPTDFEHGRSYPVAFLIHGGPQGAWNDNWSTRWNPQIFAAAGYGVVAINFHGSTGYGQDFTDAIGRHWGSHPFYDLEVGLEHVLSRYDYLDPQRVAGLGASYGGFMVNWINGHSDKFKVLVNHDGIFSTAQTYYTTDELYFPEKEFGGSPIYPENRELYEKWSPSNYVQNWKTPTLIIHGGRDYRLTTCEALSTFTALQRQGIPSRFLYFPDENHWVLKPANSLRWHREGKYLKRNEAASLILLLLVLGWINQYTQESSNSQFGLHYQE